MTCERNRESQRIILSEVKVPYHHIRQGVKNIYVIVDVRNMQTF